MRLICYVDDIIIFGKPEEINGEKEKIFGTFRARNCDKKKEPDGGLRFQYLGMEIIQYKDRVIINQTPAIEKNATKIWYD